ncbi:MAG TPA: hypothetical protein PKB06_04735, partial [Actinotalea sp.]|nr:hypothetical protein [Actinotalea sp.]
PEQPAATAPVITGALQIDPPPTGDNNEHPELVGAAIDGDPSTRWYSRTYASPTYGMKPGIGFAVTLQEPAVVSTVTVQTTVTGGSVEIRLTDPATPTEGEVLAAGPLSSPTTEFVLTQPTEGAAVVLWFTALPQTSDGRNRVEISDIQVG